MTDLRAISPEEYEDLKRQEAEIRAWNEQVTASTRDEVSFQAQRLTPSSPQHQYKSTSSKDEKTAKVIQLLQQDGVLPTEKPLQLLEDLITFIRRFVSLASRAEALAIALWIFHTHAIEAADTTPYLAITSPEKRSGKSRLLEVLELFVARPIRTGGISEAAMFRVIEKRQPTLLIDELDTVFGRQVKGQNESIRGLLNNGHRRGATVLRCVGEGKSQDVAEFEVFCPKALAGIGRLPDTVQDRSIVIRMQRKAPTEQVARFRRRDIEPEAETLRNQIGTWAASNSERLDQAHPHLPESISDRAADGWEPLLAIADLIGVGEEARAAAVELSTQGSNEDSYGVLLLSHMKEIFDEASTMRISTHELARQLIEREDGPWAGWWIGYDLDGDELKVVAQRISKLLRPYEIKARKMRVGDKTFRGYERRQLESAWNRYLAP